MVCSFCFMHVTVAGFVHTSASTSGVFCPAGLIVSFVTMYFEALSDVSSMWTLTRSFTPGARCGHESEKKMFSPLIGLSPLALGSTTEPCRVASSHGDSAFRTFPHALNVCDSALILQRLVDLRSRVIFVQLNLFFSIWLKNSFSHLSNGIQQIWSWLSWICSPDL